jgi:UrcA family protein
MTRIALVAIAALMTAASAHAQAAQAVVHFKDLDLSRAHDMKVLDQRLATAALEVCQAGAGSSAAVVDEAKNSACFKQAMGAGRSAALAVANGSVRTAAR